MKNSRLMRQGLSARIHGSSAGTSVWAFTPAVRRLRMACDWLLHRQIFNRYVELHTAGIPQAGQRPLFAARGLFRS